jgi:hypothetical protein
MALRIYFFRLHVPLIFQFFSFFFLSQCINVNIFKTKCTNWGCIWVNLMVWKIRFLIICFEAIWAEVFITAVWNANTLITMMAMMIATNSYSHNVVG